MGKVTRITDEQINKIIEMYLQDYSKVYIAKQLGISSQSVTKYLVKNEIKQKEYFLSDDVKNLICKLYVDQDMSIKEISNKLNVDNMSVKRALQKNNIQLRTLSESLRKYSLDETYFDNIDSPNKAYILGFLYADGKDVLPYRVQRNSGCTLSGRSRNDRKRGGFMAVDGGDTVYKI